MISTSCQTSGWREAISFTQDDRGGDSNTSDKPERLESGSDWHRNQQRRGRTGSVSQRRQNKHQHQWRDERGAASQKRWQNECGRDAASLNAVRIKSKEQHQQMSEPSPMANRSWPLEVQPIVRVKARRMQVTAERLKLWQKPFATKKWHLRRNCLQSHI